jgi:pilus assembly protein Flp/PilA
VTAFIKGLFAGEEGATMVEYALLVALIGAALVGTVTALSGQIGAKFTSVGGTIAAAS